MRVLVCVDPRWQCAWRDASRWYLPAEVGGVVSRWNVRLLALTEALPPASQTISRWDCQQSRPYRGGLSSVIIQHWLSYVKFFLGAVRALGRHGQRGASGIGSRGTLPERLPAAQAPTRAASRPISAPFSVAEAGEVCGRRHGRHRSPARDGIAVMLRAPGSPQSARALTASPASYGRRIAPCWH